MDTGSLYLQLRVWIFECHFNESFSNASTSGPDFDRLAFVTQREGSKGKGRTVKKKSVEAIKYLQRL